MAKIFDGKALQEKLALELSAKIKKLGFTPGLLIIQVGDRVESNTYIKRKKEFGEKIGAKVIHEKFPEDVSENKLVERIKEANSDKKIQGIIVQLPLPENLNPGSIIEEIDQKKDVDGQTVTNLNTLSEGNPKFIPATAKGVLSILEDEKIEVKGKNVVVVGRSNLVGKPTAEVLLNKGANVTVGHSKTENLPEVTREADILIVAIGNPEFIGKEFVRAGQVVIDVGINRREGERKLVGDVNFSEVEPIVDFITPVPGGVGPMTIISLFENLYEASLDF